MGQVLLSAQQGTHMWLMEMEHALDQKQPVMYYNALLESGNYNLGNIPVS